MVVVCNVVAGTISTVFRTSIGRGCRQEEHSVPIHAQTGIMERFLVYTPSTRVVVIMSAGVLLGQDHNRNPVMCSRPNFVYSLYDTCSVVVVIVLKGLFY